MANSIKEGGATSCTMSPSVCAENANNVSKMPMRNASSLSTESSDFEFDVHEETPLSPKLLISPVNYIPNHFPDEESVLTASAGQSCAQRDYRPNHFPDGESVISMVSTKHQHCADGDNPHEKITSPTNSAHILAQNGLISSSRASSEGEDGNGQFMGAVNHEKQGLRSKSEHVSVDHHTGKDNYDSYACQLRANYDVNGGRRGTNLRSLLHRRDLEQLLPLTNCNNDQTRKETVSVPAASPSSSPLNYHANHFSKPCKREDSYSEDAAAAASPPDSKGSQKKSKKWAFKLDFLKRTSSPRVDRALNHRASSDNHADYQTNPGIRPNQQNHCGSNAAADEVGSDDYSSEREHDAVASAPGEAGNQVNQRSIHQYQAAAAASEARFNRLINQSINFDYSAAADHATKAKRINQQINQTVANYRVAPAAVITKYVESPRHSTCSVISSVSSTPRHADYERSRANHRKTSGSAPMSPAGSPPRSSRGAGEQGDAFTVQGRAPMSPHALHYEQQKARADGLRRKTYLPYRQSLLGACFFPLSTHPHQAVY